MLNKVLLSIVVPIYNMEKYLDDCLNSLFYQETNFDYEVIFVNDGSVDKSQSIVELFIRDNEINNWHLYKKPNGGLSSARNYGLELIKGEYFSFIDSDDWVSKNYVDIICSSIKKNNLSFFYFNRYYSSSGSNIEVSYPDISETILERPSILNEINLSACNKVFKTKEMSNLRFPHGMLYEDFPFVIEAIFISGQIGLIDEYLYFVRQDTPDSITNKLNPRECDMLSNMISVEEIVSSKSQELIKEFHVFRDKTLLYWYIKLLRYNSFSMIGKSNFVKLSLCKQFSFRENLLIIMINLGLNKLVRLLIKISDSLKESK
ncbi:glycosyltransferase family 2 protein [Vibrio splendidus]|uniref:glycosyltransferase family 2 protein n=1 Tax=Vibrio splendidus TaxID=29497 RepID=UPI0034A0B288